MFFIKYSINLNKNNTHLEFGIHVFKDEKIIKSIHSISENKEDIEKIVSLCNELDIEMCHLDDIIEDYLTDFSI